MKQCIGQLKFEECMTFKEKMENRGWHNCYDVEPDEPGNIRFTDGTEVKERHITKVIIYGSS